MLLLVKSRPWEINPSFAHGNGSEDGRQGLIFAETVVKRRYCVEIRSLCPTFNRKVQAVRMCRSSTIVGMSTTLAEGHRSFW